MLRRSLCLVLLSVAVYVPVAHAAPAKIQPAAKKAAVVKPPPAPPKGKAVFPKQKRRRPAGKIIKIFPGDKRVDPKELAAAPTANQVAAKKAAAAVVKPPKAALKPKRPIKAMKSPR